MTTLLYLVCSAFKYFSDVDFILPFLSPLLIDLFLPDPLEMIIYY